MPALRRTHRRSASAHPTPVKRLPLALTVLLTGTFIGTTSNSVVNVPLVDIMAEFDAPFAKGAFVVIGFLIAMAASMPLVGWAGDRFGRRRVYCGALVGSAVCSVGAATAPTLDALIAWRVLDGTFTATFAPVVMGLITWLAGPERRVRAVSAWAGVNGAAQAVGPSLGGFITQVAGWRWIFVPVPPLAMIALVGTLILIPRYPAQRISLDRLGAVTLTLSSTLLLLALSLLPMTGMPNWVAPALLGAAAALGGVYIWHSLRAPKPFIDLRAVAQTRYRRSAVAAMAHMFALGATLLSVPLHLREYGFASGTVGLIVLALPVTLVLVAPFIGAVGERFGPRRLMRIGLVILGCAQIGIGVALNPVPPPVVVVTGLLVANGIGMGFIQTLAAAGTTRSAAGASGSGLGLFNLLRFGSSATGGAWVSASVLLSGSPLFIFAGTAGAAAIALVVSFVGRNPEDDAAQRVSIASTV
ncbi:MFS transporter [Mycolicibacterium sp. YH-1]|uniref:MFS transporter n=1 Tax=Mycolicibacterium sp. YH-1 TaxID=2908837 RepID=UPI001F4C0559|nr:MFS transporter [Mycolicibacterium sp. YH-1]UNB52188.1 MFS transporter [Mycolicibacterium sp. YH-1]